MLNFNAEKHEYSLPTGEVLISVTQVIDRSGLVDTSHFTEFHRMRRQAVHMACEYDDRGCLDESSIDPRILPYVEAYRRFKAEVEFAHYPRATSHQSRHRSPEGAKRSRLD